MMLEQRMRYEGCSAQCDHRTTASGATEAPINTAADLAACQALAQHGRCSRSGVALTGAPHVTATEEDEHEGDIDQRHQSGFAQAGLEHQPPGGMQAEACGQSASRHVGNQQSGTFNRSMREELPRPAFNISCLVRQEEEQHVLRRVLIFKAIALQGRPGQRA